MTYQLVLLTRREHTAQKVTMQCHELLTSLHCHELSSWCLSYDGSRASAGPLLFSFSCLDCNGDSLYSPGGHLPAMPPDVTAL
ncbi:MAG: hypothetical protein ABIO96_08320 [Nitrospiraceae bacterium]